MKKGVEILVFSILACVILVVEFFYIPWGSINKNSSIGQVNYSQGVVFNGSITNAPKSSGSYNSYSEFISPTITSSYNSYQSAPRSSYSKSSTSNSQTYNYNVIRKSENQYVSSTTASSSSMMGASTLASNNATSSSFSGIDNTPSLSGGLTSLNSDMLKDKDKKKDLNQTPFNEESNSDPLSVSDFGSKMRKASMSPPPPELTVDSYYALPFILIVYLLLRIYRLRFKKHVV